MSTFGFPAAGGTVNCTSTKIVNGKRIVTKKSVTFVSLTLNTDCTHHD